MVDYGATGGFLALLFPGPHAAGSDLQDCFSHWLVDPASRRLLAVRRPIAGRPGVHLLLPSGLDLSLGGLAVASRKSVALRPGFALRFGSLTSRATYVSSRLRATEPSFCQTWRGPRTCPRGWGYQDKIRFRQTRPARFHAKDKRRLWPRQLSPWLSGKKAKGYARAEKNGSR